MPIHFEQLWEKCENYHQKSGDKSTTTTILDELVMKISLYKALDAQTNLPDILQIKSRALGEILLTLTNLSAKDNINTYEALSLALQHRKG
jgi:hypothetical protein